MSSGSINYIIFCDFWQANSLKLEKVGPIFFQFIFFLFNFYAPSLPSEIIGEKF